MKLTLNEWFSEGRGRLCMHSDKYVFVKNGKLFSGTRCNSRDLINKPYTDDELAQQAAFRLAAAKRKLIYESETLKADWQARFRSALSAHSTKCHSLSGFIMNMAFSNHISDDGSYQA